MGQKEETLKTRKRTRVLLTVLLSLGALFLLQPAAMADMVSMTLTGVNNGYVMGPAYVDPYAATIGNQSGVLVICDDFTAETWVGESWNASVSTVSNLVGNKFKGPEQGVSMQQAYDAAAWLAEELMQPSNMNNSQNAGNISYAIWSIFAPGAAVGLPDANLINSIRIEALGKDYTGFNFSNVYVYTEIAGSATNCGGVGVTCPTNSPQEFLVVTPEASTPVILAFELLSLLGVVFFVRRRANAGTAR